MEKKYCSGDVGFCLYSGRTSSITLTWNDDTVVAVECSDGNHETCGYEQKCNLYQRRPLGFVQTYPLKDKSVQ